MIGLDFLYIIFYTKCIHLLGFKLVYILVFKNYYINLIQFTSQSTLISYFPLSNFEPLC